MKLKIHTARTYIFDIFAFSSKKRDEYLGLIYDNMSHSGSFHLTLIFQRKNTGLCYCLYWINLSLAHRH